jgi:hypothetical protein
MKQRYAVRVVGLMGLVALMTGCGGVQGSHSVSPATFLLPGLMKVEPKRSPIQSPKPEIAATDLVSPAATTF